MENQQIEQLHKLSWDEKFEIIQMLWNDLANNPENLNLPDEHKNILRQRIESGEAKFKPWHEIKAKYLPA
jgi:putative addiction module component (TIGR02574 family)